MVYKKYIKRNGKVFGPYYYESYRENGKVKTRFIAGPNEPPKKLNKSYSHTFLILFLVLIGLFFILMILGNLNYKFNISGKVIQEEALQEPSETEKEIAGKIANNELASNTDIREIIEPTITEPLFENTKLLEFESPNGKIKLDFDILNYSAFIEREVEEEIEKENFDIQVNEHTDKYKWGYNVKLIDQKFMAKITLESEKEIFIIDNQTFRIGNSYVSFADLAEKGFILSVNEPLAIIESINTTDNAANLTNTNETLELSNESELNEAISEISDINQTDNESSNNETENEINETENDPLEGESSIINKTDNETINLQENPVSNETPSSEDLPDTETEKDKEEKNPKEEKSIIDKTGKKTADIQESPAINESTSEELEDTDNSPERKNEEKIKEEKEKENEQSEVENNNEDGTDIVGIVTTSVIRPFAGFIVRGVTGLSTLSEEKYKATLYLTKDFSDSNYSVGDIINIDPTLIILITKAEHLDKNKNFITDIYDSVKEKDNNWSEVIPNEHYVRVTFEQNLTRKNDITLFARSSSLEPARIEVYTLEGTTLLTTFENIQQENWYKVYLSSLEEGESYSVFDLKVLGNVEFDYIVDPINTISFVDPTPANGTTTANTSLLANVSIVGFNISEVNWNWNGTNYTLFNNSMVLMFNFNNYSALGENDSYVVDISGNGNNGTYGDRTGGNSGVNCTVARYGCALMFDGDDSLNISDNDGLTGMGNLTLEAWVYINPHNSNSQGPIIDKSDTSNPDSSYSLDFGASGRRPRFFVSTNGFSPSDIGFTNVLMFNTSLLNSTWYHIAAIYNGTNLLGYINGVLDNSTNATKGTVFNGVVPLRIGYTAPVGGEIGFNGTIDEVRIWNQSFNATEVYQLYTANLQKYNNSDWYLLVNQSQNTSTAPSGKYSYFASAINRTGTVNMTEVRYITFNSDVTSPAIIIVVPSNNTNTTDTSQDINFTFSDASGIGSCWYSNDTYTINLSLGSGGTCVNITNITWSEGMHNVTIWVNDTLANTAQNSTTFRIDSIAPTIPFVEAIAATNPTESSFTAIAFTISLNDSVGVAHLNDTSVTANFTKANELTRINNSCVKLAGQNTSLAQNYSCTIHMWYFDGSGSWNINVYGKDLSGNAALNTSTTFTLNQLKALVISPRNIAFNVNIGATNITSNQNTTINNTGNYNATGNISLNAINLYSGTTYIDVGNFTVDIEANVDACDGIFLQNGTYKNVSGAILEKGNLSLGNANETLYYCFTRVPSIASGNYNTETAGSWTIRINIIQSLIKMVKSITHYR